jgi:hypothetical protein
MTTLIASLTPRRLLDRVVDVFTSPKSGPVLVTAILFLLMYVGGGLRYHGFFAGQVVLNLLIDNAYLIVLAVGMSLRDPHRGTSRSAQWWRCPPSSPPGSSSSGGAPGS